MVSVNMASRVKAGRMSEFVFYSFYLCHFGGVNTLALRGCSVLETAEALWKLTPPLVTRTSASGRQPPGAPLLSGDTPHRKN